MLLNSPMATKSKRNLASTYADNLATLTTDSTLGELKLCEVALDIGSITKTVLQLFEEDTMLPGIVLLKDGHFYGMISRRRFLKRMSRPYALELFLQRPLATLYNVEDFPVNILPESMSILDAAQFALECEEHQMYEPIVVEQGNGQYAVVDMSLLLYAQSHIHKLTSQLLADKTHAHMVQTEKMASLGRMVAGVAHEIRNPVNCVHGNVSFLRHYFDDLLGLLQAYQTEISTPSAAIAQHLDEVELDFLKEDLPKILQSVEVSAVRMTEIVTSLRNFSRLDETKQQLINLPECIDSTLLILNNRCKTISAQIHKNYGKNVPEILGFAGQLSQVFINLLANALDAMEEKKTRLMCLGEDWQPEISITISLHLDENEAIADNTQDWVCVEIRDNASGMSEEVQQKIFDDFFTTKPRGKGTGLGLAITNEIITKKHHGRIDLQSDLGLGTSFFIWLPL